MRGRSPLFAPIDAGVGVAVRAKPCPFNLTTRLQILDLHQWRRGGHGLPSRVAPTPHFDCGALNHSATFSAAVRHLCRKVLTQARHKMEFGHMPPTAGPLQIGERGDKRPRPTPSEARCAHVACHPVFASLSRFCAAIAAEACLGEGRAEAALRGRPRRRRGTRARGQRSIWRETMVCAASPYSTRARSGSAMSGRNTTIIRSNYFSAKNPLL